MQTISDLMTTNLLTINRRDLVGGSARPHFGRGHSLRLGSRQRRTSAWRGDVMGPRRGVCIPRVCRQRHDREGGHSVGPDEPVTEAAALMMSNWIHHRVVVDDSARPRRSELVQPLGFDCRESGGLNSRRQLPRIDVLRIRRSKKYSSARVAITCTSCVAGPAGSLSAAPS